jgi:hypothetical protein
MPSRAVDEVLAKFDAVSARIDGHVPIATRQVKRIGKRAGNMAIAVMALIAATIGFGLFVGPIGLGGLFLVAVALIGVLIFFSVYGGGEREPKRVAYSEELPTKAVVQQLSGMLSRRRAALPAPAARRVDAISQQLPLLENRLAEANPLDPLAQDARRLLGKHLPELIDRYEKVPAQLRAHRDGEGLTVDERLVASLDAARTALDDIGARLHKQDLDAFETQGRFIESRYKDGGAAEV